jgi:hypothetical protein
MILLWLTDSTSAAILIAHAYLALRLGAERSHVRHLEGQAEGSREAVRVPHDEGTWKVKTLHYYLYNNKNILPATLRDFYVCTFADWPETPAGWCVTYHVDAVTPPGWQKRTGTSELTEAKPRGLCWFPLMGQLSCSTIACHLKDGRHRT